MMIRDRIKELRRVRAESLRPHPRNWRTHPKAQQDALRGLLAEIGYADALLARELPDGSLELIDGHLRAETTPEAEVPVLVLDVDEDEAAKILATLDPLGALAQRDEQTMANLLSTVNTENKAVQAMLDAMLRPQDPSPPATEPHPLPALSLHETWQVVIECESEHQQRQVFERMAAEGFQCRLLSL